MARHAAIAMRNNKMNKTWLFTTLTLALVAAAPAHAISAKYREQLERSGCTQMTDGTTCDIHKTKAENAAAAQRQQRLRPLGGHLVCLYGVWR